MPPDQTPDLFEMLWDFLSQILFPDWPDLIALLPLVFLGLIAAFAIYVAWLWRRAGERNRPRVPRRLATGSPPPGVHLPGPSRWPFVLPIGLTLVFFGLIFVSRGELGALALVLLVGGLAVTVIGSVGWLRDAMREWRSTEVGHEAEAWAASHGRPHALEQRAAMVALPAHAAGADAVAERGFVPPPEPPPGLHLPGPSPWPFLVPIGITMIFFGLILSPWLIVGGLVLSLIAAGGWLREASREWRSTDELGHAVPETRDPVQAWPRRLVPIFAWVIALSIVVALLPLGIGWLAGLGPPEATPTPVAVPAQPEIVAIPTLAFDRSVLVVPAGRDFELVFDNQEPAVPHDVAITDGPPPPAIFYFDGEIITGPDTITYQVPALEEGDYYFYCTIHPNMNGTVQARPEHGPPPNGE